MLSPARVSSQALLHDLPALAIYSPLDRVAPAHDLPALASSSLLVPLAMSFTLQHQRNMLTSTAPQNHPSCRRHPSSLPTSACWLLVRRPLPPLPSLRDHLVSHHSRSIYVILGGMYLQQESPQTHHPPPVAPRASAVGGASRRLSSRGRRLWSCWSRLALRRTWWLAWWVFWWLYVGG
jgi:hypothetical protein